MIQAGVLSVSHDSTINIQQSSIPRMVTLQDSLLSSSARNSPIRMRPDLIAQRQHYLGRTYWVVKDPVGLAYYRFQEEEFAILQMFDGAISLDEVKDRFEAEFPPQKITLEELQQFLGMLHRSGLVIADVPGQGHQLRKRRDERKRKMLLAAASNILCIRFKGFDPERLLNWLYPKIRWFFSPLAVFCCCALALFAATLVAVEFDEFRSKLPEFHQFFSVHNAFLLAIVLGITKVFHEFGHGLSCKHFGGECHEMGIMVLVLTPCLYCNVSDSWMLPSKWARAAIGAAGIYVEVRDRLDLHVHVVDLPARDSLQQPLPRRDVHLLGHHHRLQRQPAAPLRRLLHPCRLDGDSESAAEGHDDSQPQAGRVVPRARTARRPLPAAAKSVVLRALLARRGSLPLGRGAVDLLVPLPAVPLLSSGDHRQD